MFCVQLEVTTRCNAKCRFCPRAELVAAGKRQLADIDINFFREIVSAVDHLKRALNVSLLVSISGLGEPLLYPHILEAIQAVGSLGPKTQLRLNTNCLNLKGALAEKLVNSGVTYLLCSLSLATPELYEQQKQSPDFQRVKGNILSFLQRKGNRPPSVRLRLNQFDVNLPHLKAASRFWRQHLNQNDKLDPGFFSNWAGKISRADYVKKGLGPRKPCKYLWNHLTINLHGDVFVCCIGISETRQSALYLGNIRKGSTLLQLYNSRRLKRLRAAHRARKYPSPCDVCDSWKRHDGP